MTLAIVKLLLSLADQIATYLTQGQLLDAGRAMSDSKNLAEALKDVELADAAAGKVAAHLAANPKWLPTNDPNYFPPGNV